MELRDLIGIPFKTHGRDKNGYDCYGLAIEVLRRNNIYLPDVFYDSTNQSENIKTSEIIKNGLPLEKIEKKELWCLIDIAVRGQSAHCGVYIGNGQFIHSTRDCGVCVQNLARYEKQIKGFYRVKQ